jgi:hypothetical protein
MSGPLLAWDRLLGDGTACLCCEGCTLVTALRTGVCTEPCCRKQAMLKNVMQCTPHSCNPTMRISRFYDGFQRKLTAVRCGWTQPLPGGQRQQPRSQVTWWLQYDAARISEGCKASAEIHARCLIPAPGWPIGHTAAAASPGGKVCQRAAGRRRCERPPAPPGVRPTGAASKRPGPPSHSL